MGTRPCTTSPPRSSLDCRPGNKANTTLDYRPGSEPSSPCLTSGDGGPSSAYASDVRRRAVGGSDGEQVCERKGAFGSFVGGLLAMEKGVVDVGETTRIGVFYVRGPETRRHGRTGISSQECDSRVYHACDRNDLHKPQAPEGLTDLYVF